MSADFASETTLGLVKAKTDNLDVLLSTVSQQVTLALIKAKTDNIDTLLSTLIGVTLANGIFAPQLISGDTDVNFSALAVTADASLYSVTVAKTLYLSDVKIAFSSTVAGIAYLRDGIGGSIIDVIGFPVTAGTHFISSFKKPKQLTTGVYFDLISGTISANFVCGGIEK